MDKDPDYAKRLESLPEKEKKALLEGDWDIFEGQYFSEFKRDIHVIEPFEIPKEWNRYLCMDYGLDMLAVLWIAIDTKGKAYVYKELYQSDLIISEASRRIKEVNGNDKYLKIYAPPDLWNRRQETGNSAEDIFKDNGLLLHKSNNNRVRGWYTVKEYLKVYETRDVQTGETYKTADIKIFNNCRNLIRTLPQLQHDERDPNDVANEPHELTHINDALRMFCIERTKNTLLKTQEQIERDKYKQEKWKNAVKSVAGARATKSYINFGG